MSDAPPCRFVERTVSDTRTAAALVVKVTVEADRDIQAFCAARRYHVGRFYREAFSFGILAMLGRADQARSLTPSTLPLQGYPPATASPPDVGAGG